MLIVRYCVLVILITYFITLGMCTNPTNEQMNRLVIKY